MVRKQVLLSVAVLIVAGCGAKTTGQIAGRSSLQHQGLSVGNTKDENTKDENTKDENTKDENTKQENTKQENTRILASTLVNIDLSPAITTRGVVWDTTLTATALGGHSGRTALSAADFVGSYFIANYGNGRVTTVTITSHSNDVAPNQDLDLYMVKFLDLDHGASWKPLCVDDDGNAEFATAVLGYWDYTVATPTGGSKTESTTKFTFACQSGAIGKCIDWGYRPWATDNGVSLAPYHEACTRMTRADYCGDGDSHTVDGAIINIYDNLGIQTDTESWVLEAQWNSGGATCLAPGGVADGGSGVSCYNHLVSSSCAADNPSAMLTTETPTGARMP